ncbi:preprotein translocase subunit SecA [Patescibacteria group bacterium]|jgi:preprotein translocase subunit SecA|nr:preprotein translocase subunit SecA [Patescibacteria group bacterium]
MFGALKGLFGDRSQQAFLAEARALTETVASWEEDVAPLSDAELAAKTDTFKARLAEDAALDDLLPEAFAVVRESAKRLLGERHYDVQIMGGVALHRGMIAEMRTGEGKTLVGTLPTYLNALAEGGVHVVTVNDYLSRRDAVWMGQIYHFLGLSVGVVGSDGSYRYDPSHQEGSAEDAERDEQGSFKVQYEFLRPCTKTEAYAADITYGTNSEFGFDYLRDNIEYEAANLRQRPHEKTFAIIDEIDSILIDEARTPLIISAPAAESENLYEVFTRIARELKRDEDFTVDEKLKAVQIKDSGIEKAERALGVENLYTDAGIKHVHHLETAVRAKALFERDQQYVVRDGQVVIVDEFTGRLQPGRRWSDGLHQAIEAKEGVAVQRESRTFASITYQNYFKLYGRLAGMTGTAATSAEEFYSVYKLDVVEIPTHRPVQRIDHHDLIYRTEAGKFTAITRTVRELHEKGQPVLIGTASIEKNEELSAHLTREGIPHELLNAKNHEREGEIIAQAGRRGRVTIATNMAGRGVDIKLGGNPAPEGAADEIRELGGLYVLGTERHEARRIDNQLRGRTGRQGDPGATQFFVSLEDTLMRVFATDMVSGVMSRLSIPEDEPIQNRMISRSLETAQTKIEGFHFDARKRILSYDNVLNLQRTTIYARRRTLLLGSDEDVDAFLDELIGDDEEARAAAQAKRAELGEEAFLAALRRLALQTIDLLWMEHLETMEYVRSSVNLRAYGQRDPLIEYRKEGLRLFKELELAIEDQIIERIPQLSADAFQVSEADRTRATSARTEGGAGGTSATTGGAGAAPPRPASAPERPGRNDLVTITNGSETKTLKYKKAEPLIASGWRISS